MTTPEETTGRYVVVLADEAHDNADATADALKSVTGAQTIALASDFAAGALDVEQSDADATVFDELGVAVVTADPAGLAAMTTAGEADPRILAIEPELIHHALAAEPAPGPESIGFVDTAQLTWGLQATAVGTSPRTGKGVRVAVLDTGFDLGHPDFQGRNITAQSFVPGQQVQDLHGHGTHCIGTSCGPKTLPQGRRYGVGFQVEIFVGKVLSNAGSGTDTSILAGINWAITNGCAVISMSLGANVQTVSQAYEAVGRRALRRGTLIVAAAGNNAQRRFGNLGFVGVPANSPSIMAVAALDAAIDIADFSARSNPVGGGHVDIAAPGVAVYSSWPMPTRYNTISGTSMATPHVAGIAALWCEATGARGLALWSEVVKSVRGLPLPSVDVGAGLAQAPQQ